MLLYTEQERYGKLLGKDELKRRDVRKGLVFFFLFDFALKPFDDFVSSQGLNFERVELAGGAKLQFNDVFKPFN